VRTLADVTGVEPAMIGQVYQFTVEWLTGILLYM
jgi:hypothetical protein